MVGVSYIIWKVFESTFRNRFRLSVRLYHDLQKKAGLRFQLFILNVWCYTSMDSSQRDLQTYVKLFTNSGIIFRINYNFFNNNGVGFLHAMWGRHLCWSALVSVLFIFDSDCLSDCLSDRFRLSVRLYHDLQKKAGLRFQLFILNVWCYTSMDSSQRDLQTYVKLFTNSGIIFRINYNFFNNNGVGFLHAMWGRHLCWSALVSVLFIFIYLCVRVFNSMSKRTIETSVKGDICSPLDRTSKK